ncbi:myoneurin-like isoform X6 [Ostrea edulis]|uniref:myoneurin-like isoform X6 n=1 Tax=Ostrea edulis TaxID=37623 RepID=UPI0024AFE17A|nr:myoneurin-like isoform X6 [Ostrea edulis]
MSYQKMYMNQIYSSSIMRQVALMWKNQLLCDAVIKTGNVQTKAHRLVLIAACPMLQDTDNASVGSHLEVRLNSDITETAVTTFLQYLYEGYMMLTEDNCRDVEKIAKLLHMDSITKCCTDFQKCMNIKMGYTSSQGLNFDLQDSIDFRFVNTTDLLKMVPENQLKRLNKEMNPVSPAYKRPRYQQSGHFSNHSSQRPDDHLSMNDSYNISSERIQARSQSQDEGVIDISENSVELVNIGPGARDTDGWPINTDLPPIRTSSSVSVTNQKETASDVQIVDVQPARIDRSQPQQCNIATYGRIQDSRSNSFIAGTSQAIPVDVQSHSPSSARGTEESPQYISMSSNTVRENTPALSPLSSGSPNSNRKHRGADEISRPFALGSAPTEHRSFSMLPASSIKAVDLVQNAHIYPETQKSIKDITYRNSNDEVKEKRTSASPEPIVVKLEEEDTESGKIEVYIQDPQNDSYSHDPGDPGGEGLVELDTDLSNDDSITMEPGPSWQPQEGQDRTVTQGLNCRFCQKSFSQAEDLSLHLRDQEKHTQNIQYCIQCDLVFYSTQIFKNHIFNRHSENRSRCPICSIPIKHTCNFRRHVLSHFVDKPFLCTKCGCGFKRKDNLKKHVKKNHFDKMKTFIS